MQSAKCKVKDNFLALLGNFHFIENGTAHSLRHSEVVARCSAPQRANLAVFPQKNGA
jgi:hypothetical protein